MLSFRRKYPGPGGSTLIIQPLTLEWIVEAADLLSGTFAESMGYLNVYQRFLNNQIRKYLVCHVGLPPKAVVLACFLIEPQHAQHADESAAAPPEEDTRSAPVATSSSDSSSTEASTALGSDFGDGMGMGWLSSDENGAEIIDKLNVEGDARSITNGWAETTPGGAAAGLEVSPGKGAVLVGSVELSFSKSTRSNELTLTPPADRPYLCNFAVAEEWRGQGIGSKLLAASEELVATVGETSIYLHLRFKDKSAAAFYDKAGYTSVAEDSIFVLLLGLDRRFLMRKELNRGGGAEGRTLLKMEGAGAPADWS